MAVVSTKSDTAIDICNRGLILIGAEPITSLMMEQQKQEDPYAWAKARAAEQAAGELTPAPAPVPAAQPQHPGWIWDAQTNQWVADPNYRPPQQ